MVAIEDAKRAWRKRMRAARRGLDQRQREQESSAASQVCLRLAESVLPPALASYAACGEELDLSAVHTAWWSVGGCVLLPRVLEPGMVTWHAVRSVTELRVGAFSILEPDPAMCPQELLPTGTLLLVPGLGFTSDGKRIGQGGGYYDRVLAAHPGCLAVGIGFACQLVDDLPCELHDRRLDGLVIAGDLVRDPRLT